MPAGVIGEIWEAAASPACSSVVRRFEAEWRAAPARRKPDPRQALEGLGGSVPPGALLALLRAEMTLCWDAGEHATAEDYRQRYPELDSEALVALAYEEFCLREEAGLAPETREFLERYPALADGLKRVLDIHGLVGSGETATFGGGGEPGAPAFPEAGQTIAGFRLVAELGRGSFARVFRAEERQLADRAVVLKVARSGSREPQTLARLQHTHIVPVHSYRTDPATGLHLLCMPYLGGVTLAQLLGDPQVAAARTGADLLAALDRLAAEDDHPPSAARESLAGRSFVRAIALWGSRLALALQHAHERGVLHRDVKPSNVLVTSDGLPMLLDFNLAWESRLGEAHHAPGGTLAYMAPEQLEALADGRHGGGDPRSDIYSLGVVLYEAMGSRPFDAPERGSSIKDTLHRTAERRRLGPPPLQERHPEVSAEFAAVVERCLEADPNRRYPNAAALAVDLQAVADDQPLRHAREPLPSRLYRWTRRNRLRLALAAPALAAVLLVLAGIELTRRSRERLTHETLDMVSKGMVLAEEGRLDAAEAQFELALTLASRGSASLSPRRTQQLEATRIWGGLDELQAVARDQKHLVGEKRKARADADRLAESAELLRLRLLHFTDSRDDPSDEVRAALKPFYVLAPADWSRRGELNLLEQHTRQQVESDVASLLFLWGIDLSLRLRSGSMPADRDRLASDFRTVCAVGSRTAAVAAPWNALLDRLGDDSSGLHPAHGSPVPRPGRSDDTAAVAFQWGALLALEGQTRPAIDWLERAVQLAPDQYWYHYYLAYQYQQISGAEEQALAHYLAAIALAPDRPWPRFNVALLYGNLSAWARAINELKTAADLAGPGPSRFPILVNLGQAHHRLGNVGAARQAYQEVLETAGSDDPLRRAACLNLARLDAENGAVDRALNAYDTLLTRDDDAEARLGRAMLFARTGRWREARRDLDELLRRDPRSLAALTCRAEVNLGLGELNAALADATAAFNARPDRTRERLRMRVALAGGNLGDLSLEDPAELERLPLGGARLTKDLQALVAAAAGPGEAHDPRWLLHRAVIRSALNEHAAAERDADEAVARSSGMTLPLLVRGRIRNRAGHRRGALHDAQAGLRIDADDARFLLLRGRVLSQLGDHAAALADLDQAQQLGASRAVHQARAETLLALHRQAEAVAAWTLVLRSDPEALEAYLGRARCLAELERWDECRGDLEQALARGGGDPAWLGRIVAVYARCLPSRPECLGRVVALAFRAAVSAPR